MRPACSLTRCCSRASSKPPRRISAGARHPGIVYDLIPAVFDDLYLTDRTVRANYFANLPIAEAAGMEHPVLRSDIPIFREVGGDGALYFPPSDARALATLIEAWLAGERQADPALISRLSWADAAHRIHQILYGDEWYATLG